jgi:hypothetical protein
VPALKMCAIFRTLSVYGILHQVKLSSFRGQPHIPKLFEKYFMSDILFGSELFISMKVI